MQENIKKEKMPVFPYSGVLLVDKPAEWTSHDVVNFVRRRFNVPKVGHCGTLDPAATGLLVLVLGKATKISQNLSGSDKIYEAVILLGKETDSLDMDGTVISEKDCSKITEPMIKKVVSKFMGNIMQIPPMVSAKKVGGKKLYELARKGEIIEREAVPVKIHSIDILKIEIPYISIRVSCSKGTYIRSLASDIGKELGCGAVLYSLKRLKSGNYSLDKALSLDRLKEMTQEELGDIMFQSLLELKGDKLFSLEKR